MRLTRIVGASTLAALLAVTTACGGGRGGGQATGDPSDSDAPTDSAGTSQTFGDMASPCGPNTGAALTVPQGSDAADTQGVTATTISIGYGDDKGNTIIPGLNSFVGDAVKAMVTWCNAQGGINGRQLVGHRYDAALFNTQAVYDKSCTTDFFLVGDGFAYDDVAEPAREACDMPHLPAFVASARAANGPLTWQPVPGPIDKYNASAYTEFLSLIPGMKSKGITTLDTDSAPVESNTQHAVEIFKKLGVTVKDCGVFVHQAGETSYAPMAQALKSCGVGALYTAFVPGAQAYGFLQAAHQLKVDLPVIWEASYDQAVAKWNATTHAGDGAYSIVLVEPVENAAVNKAVADYQRIVTSDGGTPAFLGEMAASAFLLWAQAAQACGNDLTRTCVEDNLNKVHSWTAGGLQEPTDPGNRMPGKCSIIVQLDGDAWKQVWPEKQGDFGSADGSSCDDLSTGVMSFDPAVFGVKLDSNRQWVANLN
jgi:ABC-type branched-subunit amino acid transport system substrate-binding protein